MMKKIQDAGFRIAEVPVHHYHRAFGKSQFFNVRRLFRTAVDVAGCGCSSSCSDAIASSGRAAGGGRPSSETL